MAIKGGLLMVQRFRPTDVPMALAASLAPTPGHETKRRGNSGNTRPLVRN
jgi:hypothetical protein